MHLINKMEKKLELLSKVTWSTNDIMDYFEIKDTKVLEIKKQVLYKSPTIRENEKRREKVVNPEEVLKFKGSSRKKEIEIIKDIISTKHVH